MSNYTVVEDTSIQGLKDKIKELKSRGWDYLGGIAISSRDNGEIKFYVQAMVLRVKEDEG